MTTTYTKMCKYTVLFTLKEVDITQIHLGDVAVSLL